MHPEIMAAFCLQLCNAGTLTVNKIKTDLGGGECIDSEDCNNHGICKTVPKQVGRCCCGVGYSGRHCGVESKESTKPSGKMQLKRLVRPSASGGKRANVISSVLEQKLDYEPSSNIFGLTPDALAEADQPFVLYSPDKKLYMFVSHDSRVAEKNDSYVEARDDKFGSNNLFKLIRVPGKKGKFYIHSLRQNKYLYASQSSKGIFKNWNSNLLAASGISSSPNEKASFIFWFEDDDGDGLFTIRNGKKMLYVSENAVGNPPSNLLKLAAKKDLDRLDSKYFQLALKEVVSKIEFKVTGDRIPVSSPLVMTDGAQARKICYKGKNGDMKAEETNIEYVEELTDIREYTKAEGFLFNTATTEFKDTHGKKLFTHSSSGVEKIFKANTVSASLKVPVNNCTCAEVTFKYMRYNQPYEFQARTYQNKTLRSKGFIKGETNYDFQVKTELYDYREFFKCPHEI